MILAAVDDLMLASKIRQAAVRATVDVGFVRSPAETLERARTDAPSLVIFDLNSARLDPLATIARLKADATLASIPTLGFVAHVQVELIATAKAAGVDRVLARSAFFDQLTEILVDPSRFAAGLKTGGPA